MSILMVTGIEGARNCADIVAAQLDMIVEVASGRKEALAALRQRELEWPARRGHRRAQRSQRSQRPRT